MLMQNAMVEDHQLKHVKMCFEVQVVGNASPASKTLASDLSGVVVIAAEGQTAALAAVEDISGATNYAAPDDSDGKINVLIKASGLGQVAKVMKAIAHVKDSAGTFTSAPCIGIGASGLTAAGNIAIHIDTAVNFTSATGTIVLDIDYMVSE